MGVEGSAVERSCLANGNRGETSGATPSVFPLDLVFFHLSSVLVFFHGYLVFFYE